MEATSSLGSYVLLSHPPSRSSGNLLSQKNASFVSHKQLISRSCCIYASKSRDSSSYGHHYDGKLVDENMIILRMRIREIETVEMKKEIATSSDWSEWEKKYYLDYISNVCEGVGLLQRLLMDTRPSLALGMMALLMISMSMSMSQLLFHVVELTKGIM